MYRSDSYRADGWCPLCGGLIRARDDEAVKVCSRCGALLDVMMPQPNGTRARHVGEAMASVRYSLDMASLERALLRLRELRDAREVALRETLQRAGIRRIWLRLAMAALAVGFLCLLIGEQRIGGTLLIVGFLGLATRTGSLWSTGAARHTEADMAQQLDERDAVKLMQALRTEIARREQVLIAIQRGGDWK